MCRRYSSSFLHDVQIVPDIDDQQENCSSSTSTDNQPSTRKSSTESLDSVVLVQTPKHLKFRQAAAAAVVRYNQHHHHPHHNHQVHHHQQQRHQRELLRRIQSMSSSSSSSSSALSTSPASLRRVSRSTPSLTESDLEAYARGIRAIVPL